MASYTPNLNLLMKDPVTDGADTFNIETMLNENWEKIDRQVLRAIAAAAAYDAGATYQQGDFCAQGGLLYRANQAIAQPEAWTAGHWTVISITDVIRGLTAADVGAAPDGYGLGANNPRFPSGYDANQALTSGWWQASVNVPGNAWCLLFVLARGDIVYQEALTDRDASGIESTCRLRRVLFRGTWTQWEWVNPPMQIGVEYRTTERWNGKPVYVRYVNFGSAPNATTKSVSHGIENFDQCAGWTGILGGANLQGHSGITAVDINATNIAITTDKDLSASAVYVAVKYTKSTD